MNEIALELGPLVFRWYGIIIVGGAIFAAWVASKEARHRGQDAEHVWDVFVWAFIGGIIGARLYHVLSSPPDSGTGPAYYFRDNPFTTFPVGSLEIPFPTALAIWEGGLGIYGGILGGALVVFLYARRHGLHVPTWLDIAAIGILTGQAIGRWGNFVNQELYGAPTRLPWGISIDRAHRLPEYVNLPDATRFHPTFLYESLWNAIGVLFLLWVSRRYPDRLRSGDIAGMYLIIYGLGRFLVEFQRPDAWTIAGIPTAQWIGVALVIAGAALIRYLHGRPADQPYIAQQHGLSRQERRRRARQTS